MAKEFEVELSSELFINQSKLHSRQHAKAVDKYLGYKVSKIEIKLLQKYRAYDKHNDETNKKQHYKGTQTWIGLHPEALQTPYCDIYEVFALLKSVNVKQVVDIGAGYGRVGVVVNTVFPSASFVGYEIVEQRQKEGNRIYSKLGLDNCRIELQNVLEPDFILPEAEVYFIYDFSEREDVHRILQQLASRVGDYSFYLIIKGDRVEYLMDTEFKHIWNDCFTLDKSNLKIFGSSV